MPDGMGVLSRCAEKPFSLPRGDRSRAFAFGELLFFAGAKKSNQKKAPSSTSRSRGVGGEGIFGLGLLPRSENGGHPWPPPLRGFRVLVAAAGLRKSKAPASPVSRRPAADGPISVFALLDTAHAIR